MSERNKKVIDEGKVKDFISGSEEGLQYVFNTCKLDLYKFALFYIKDHHDAEEVVQKTFIKAYTKRNQLNDATAIVAWINTILYKTILDYKRSDKTRNDKVPYTLDEERMGTSKGIGESSTMEDINKRELMDCLDDEIHKLPPKYIDVVTLHYLQEFSVKEISQVLKIPSTTVRFRIKKANEILKVSLEKKGFSPTKAYFGTVGALLLMYFKEYSGSVTLQDSSLSFDNIRRNIKIDPTVGVATATATSVTAVTIIKVTLAMMAIVSTMLLVKGAIDYVSEINEEEVTEVMKSKVLDNKIIGDIYYKDVMTRDINTIQVKLLTTDVSKISVLSPSKKSITYRLYDNDLYFNASENGVYLIKMDGEIRVLSIQNIDKTSPILLEAIKDSNKKISLNIQDEYKTLDINKSYLLYEGKKYNIEEDFSVKGNFKGTLEVKLFNKKGKFYNYILFFEK